MGTVRDTIGIQHSSEMVSTETARAKLDGAGIGQGREPNFYLSLVG
jgi:hypothetical protein